MMQAAGPEASRSSRYTIMRRRCRRLPRRASPRYCNYRKTSIYAGPTDPAHIIAKMALGL
jgi:hypothetical protein